MVSEKSQQNSRKAEYWVSETAKIWAAIADFSTDSVGETRKKPMSRNTGLRGVVEQLWQKPMGCYNPEMGNAVNMTKLA